MQEQDRVLREGVYADGDLVHIPLANLEAGPGYRSQLRDMGSLVESVYRAGVLTPLWVEPHPTVPNKYVIFAGRRRYEAARLAAQRKARESPSKESIASQVARYTVPCRIFRNLRRAEQAVLSLMENVIRTNPSTQDTAREMARARRLIEEQRGKKVTVEYMMELFEGAGREAGKTFHRRHVYKLLQIGEMDDRVMEAARKNSIAFDYLEAISRLPAAQDQLALIECIPGDRLTRKEVRSVVNLLLSRGGKETDLAGLIREVRSGPSQPPAGEQAETPVRPEEQGAAEKGNPDRPASGQLSLPLPDVAERRTGETPRPDISERSSGEEEPIGHKDEPRKVLTLDPKDEGDARASIEAHLFTGIEMSTLYPRTREEWLKEVEARDGREEKAGIEKALGHELAYAPLDIAVMRAMHMYGGVPSDYLPGYLENVKEALAGSPWFRRAVACSLDLLGLLAQDEELQGLRWMPRRAFGFLLQGLCRAASAYDLGTGYPADRVPASRKGSP